MHAGPDRSDDIARDLLLRIKRVLKLPVIAFGPDLAARRAIDQTGGDTHFFARSPDTAFQHKSNIEFFGNTPPVDFGPFVGESRVARDYKQPRRA